MCGGGGGGSRVWGGGGRKGIITDAFPFTVLLPSSSVHHGVFNITAEL